MSYSDSLNFASHGSEIHCIGIQNEAFDSLQLPEYINRMK